MHRTLADDASTPIHEASFTSSSRQVTTKFSFPSWIDQWIGQESDIAESTVDLIGISRQANAERAFITFEVANAEQLSDDAFCQVTQQVYALLIEQARELRLPHPVRLWNWIPDIHHKTCNGDRYMSFNLGRFRAMQDWFGPDLSTRVPAASGVGSANGMLLVAALLADEPGRQIENPLQVPAYRYSERFGRMPPCFARATRWKDQLFIAGTAAVVGEESQFQGEFERQLDITLQHLQRMLERGFEPDIGRFTSFRVYLPQQPHRSPRAEAVRKALKELADVTVEIVSADLCRAELLVEIEAVGQRA